MRDQPVTSREIRAWVVTSLIILAFLTGLCLWGCPQYNVYFKSLKGKSQLAQAQFNRQIRVQEAEAKKEAASMEADAEVIRAEGVAKANKIIGDSLRNNEAYLRWRYIHMLEEGAPYGTQIIYIPTEAGMPILETHRLKLADEDIKNRPQVKHTPNAEQAANSKEESAEYKNDE